MKNNFNSTNYMAKIDANLDSIKRRMTDLQRWHLVKIVLDIDDLSKMLKVSKQKVLKWKNDGIIISSELPDGKIIFKLSDVRKFIDNHRINK